MTINIEKITVKDRIRKDFGDIQELAEDIKQNGLINPPVVNKDYVLLTGERRLRACKSLGWKQIEVRMMDTRDAEHELEVEISENEVRKDFSRAERIEYARRLERIESIKAEKRMADSGGNISTPLGKTRDIVADKMGIGSGKQYEKEKTIVDNKDLLLPEEFADWDEGKLSTNKAFQKIKAEQKKLREEMQDLKEERDYLESQVEELKNADPVTVEVVPDDYEDLKQKVKLYKTQAKSAEDARKKSGEQYRKELEEAKQRIKDLETRKGISELQKKLEEETEYFAIRTYNYIQQNGGYVWITERMEQLPEDKRKTFINTIHAIDAFSKQMIQNIGGYSVE